MTLQARVLVAEWFENSLRGYNKMSEKIAQARWTRWTLLQLRANVPVFHEDSSGSRLSQELEDTLVTSPGSPTAPGDSNLAATGR